jgi:hypothetical protein
VITPRRPTSTVSSSSRRSPRLKRLT